MGPTPLSECVHIAVGGSRRDFFTRRAPPLLAAVAALLLPTSQSYEPAWECMPLFEKSEGMKPAQVVAILESRQPLRCKYVYVSVLLFWLFEWIFCGIPMG